VRPNFEYFSEDPILAAALGVSFVSGLQSKGVGASLKHFAANNQETDRLLVSSDVDPRPLREIYLRAFQRVVTEAQPWTVMCSYNRINGIHASQNSWLLTDVLRGEWGFEGLVVSDWGAVAQRVPALRAGLDLEMPTSSGRTDTQIVAAITDGTLDEGVLDLRSPASWISWQRRQPGHPCPARWTLTLTTDSPARPPAVLSALLLFGPGR
jgi:beta-glucosidase